MKLCRLFNFEQAIVLWYRFQDGNQSLIMQDSSGNGRDAYLQSLPGRVGTIVNGWTSGKVCFDKKSNRRLQ